jgi:hypothetical protein
VRLDLPRFLLPGGCHFITSFGNLPSSILRKDYLLILHAITYFNTIKLGDP